MSSCASITLSEALTWPPTKPSADEHLANWWPYSTKWGRVPACAQVLANTTPEVRSGWPTLSILPEQYAPDDRSQEDGYCEQDIPKPATGRQESPL